MRCRAGDIQSTTRFGRTKVTTAWRAPKVANHLRRDRGLVDEHETRCFELGLLGFQFRAGRRDIRTILLGGVQSFF